MRKAIVGATLISAMSFGVSVATAEEPSAELIAKGRYIATASDCAACHTEPHGGAPFAGGYGISSPLGTIVSTNITPSKADGIGNYTEEEFSRAVREGVAKDDFAGANGNGFASLSEPALRITLQSSYSVALASINGNAHWPAVAGQCLADKAFSGSQITFLAETELNRIPAAINGTI